MLLFLSFFLLITSSATAETFTVKAPANLPESFTCASIYSDAGVLLPGDPVKGVEDELLALTVQRDGNQLAVESFIPREVAEGALASLELITGVLNHPRGHLQDVKLSSGKTVKACATPCLFGCDCTMLYYPGFSNYQGQVEEVSRAGSDQLPTPGQQ